MNSFLLALFVVCLASGTFANLSSSYPFSAVLLNDARGEYTLHWNFTREESIIYFAVNVSTRGWVGFGLSPNGGMVGSDVVIGWVNGGASYFQDRYAEALALPPVDRNQDWCLTSAQEDGSYTILKFNRRFVTCDDKDRDVTVDTARVVWSFNPEDPQDNNDANLMRHTQRGATSINLLGGNPQQKPVASELYLDVTVSNVTIPPARTTYWCESYQVPSDVVNTTHFVNRISPVITPHAREFVHHILVYLCPVNTPLSPAEVGMSRSCSNSTSNINNCLGEGILIGGWAVGGDEFVYPEGIAFPIGGIGQEHFVVMQMHYDNPNQRTGVVDSSGLRFYYNTVEPRNRAGIMYLGATVSRSMIVPPRTSRYTVLGVCSASCTSQYIPDEGITIIGNLLHTHVVGRSVTISHYRRDPVTNQLMELEPLDQNLNYDFDFQQFTHLRTPRVVKPGDILVMQCTYDTSTRDEITYGGESTNEEMCLSFPIFYPRPADGSSLISCASTPDLASATEFYSYIIGNNITTVEGLSPTNYEQTLENLTWAGDPMLASTLQNSLSNGRVYELCLRENSASTSGNSAVPSPDVRYQAPNVCAGVSRRELSPTCLNSEDNSSGSPPVAAASSLLVGLAAVLLSLMMK